MRQGGLNEVKVGAHVEPERVVPLLVADLLKAIVGHLECRVAHQHIDTAEFGDSALDYPAAVRRVGQVARHQYTLAAGVFNELRHLGGILVFVEIGDQHVGALAGVGDGDRAADAAVAAGDHRALAGQPARAAVGVLATVRHWTHRRLHTGNLLLLLWKTHVLPFLERGGDHQHSRAECGGFAEIGDSG